MADLTLTPDERRLLLEEFLERWPEQEVARMTLLEYVDINNKDTLTYWVETRMRPLGSIKGSFSTKFGIYRREDPTDIGSDRFAHDEIYTWMKRFGTTRAAAFDEVKRQLLEVIAFAETGEFSKIDSIGIQDLFKWKVASLYSNERLVPIFRRATLFDIAAANGMTTSSKTKLSQIHELLINNKPANEDIYSYMDRLYRQYGRKNKDNGPTAPPAPKKSSSKKPGQKATAAKNTTPQVRKSARSYIADLKHNKIQEALRNRLISEFGDAAVLLEENWVDVKLVLPSQIVFYEVKSASYASDCIEEALGQVLGYVFRDTDTRTKRIVVVGPYPPNPDDERFIEFIRTSVKLDFSYEHIDYTNTLNPVID